MNANAQQAFFVNDYYLLTSSGEKIPVIVSRQQRIELDFATMVRWANAQPIPLPVHLGEFGAYRYAPNASRALWTRAVRQAAEKVGIELGILGAGFGFWILERKFIYI